MKIDAATKKVLIQATKGKVPTRHDWKEAGVPLSDDRPQLDKLTRKLASISVGSDDKLAARYLDHIIALEEDAPEFDKMAERIRDSHSIGGGTPGQRLEDHPTMKLLTQVAEGRKPPSKDRLVELGFPDDIADATLEVAAIVEAIGKGGGPGEARNMAHELGRHTAYQMPWPDPEDTWGDLVDSIPSKAVNDAPPDYEAIANKIYGDRAGAAGVGGDGGRDGGR